MRAPQAEISSRGSSLSPSLCSHHSHVGSLTLCSNICLLAFVWLSFPSLPPKNTKHSSLSIQFFFPLWPITIPFRPAKREETESLARKKSVPFPPNLAACLKRTEHSVINHFKNHPIRSSPDCLDHIVSGALLKRGEDMWVMLLSHPLKIFNLWAATLDQESIRAGAELLYSTHTVLKTEKVWFNCSPSRELFLVLNVTGVIMAAVWHFLILILTAAQRSFRHSCSPLKLTVLSRLLNAGCEPEAEHL